MGILNLFKRKTEERHEFNETDRELSLEKRKVNAQLKKTQQEIEIAKAKLQLQELKDELYDYSDSEEEEEEPEKFNAESILITALLPLLTGQKQTSTPENNVPISPQKIDLSDETIEQLYIQYKPYMKLARKLKDEELKQFLLNKEPNLSDESLKKILARVRR
jgi:hypothetical protein